MPNCPVCRSDVRERHAIPNDMERVNCLSCGTFTVSAEALMELMSIGQRERALISGWLREENVRSSRPEVLSSQAPAVSTRTGGVRLSEILAIKVPRSIPDQLDRALLNLAAMSHHAGHRFSLSPADKSLAFAENAEEFDFCLRALSGLLDSRAWIPDIEGNLPRWIMLTPAGWQRVGELSSSFADSKKAFVAMWFDPTMDMAWTNGLMKGIADAGFTPNRVDMIHHNEKICDRIIAEIRTSRFVVADVTGQRQGVYYEAGFAQGIGIPVIWSCRKDEISSCHFDTRQYNHIAWQNPDELAARLKARINATIH